MKDDRLISLNAAIDAMMKLQTEDIEAYGASIPEGFDGDRAVTALKALPSAQPVNIAKLQPNCNQVASDCISRQAALTALERDEEYDKDIPNRADGVRDAIITISALPSAQPGWTYIEEALPETIINEHTHDYQEYNCLCDFGDNGFDVRTYKFGNGHFWNGGGIVDKYVTAWQPLPEIPDALKPKPWEGDANG